MEKVLLTVGSNPLPVVLPALVLKPTEAWLVYTPEVATVAGRAAELMTKHAIETRLFELRNHRAPGDITAFLDQQLSDFQGGLAYTAGTKLMAVHVHRWWTARGGQPSDAAYLGADGHLYFDDPAGSPLDLRQEPRLTLEQLCRLHFGLPATCPDQHQVREVLEDAKAIWSRAATGWDDVRKALRPFRVLVHGKLSVQPENPQKDPVPDSIARPDGPVRASIDLTDDRNFEGKGAFRGYPTTLPREETLEDLGKRHGHQSKPAVDGRKFLEGVWLEVWLADALERSKLFDEVHQGVEVLRDGKTEFEIDVVGIKGSRLFLFSCTSDASTGLVKGKLMEAMNRAQRLGGDHARAAVFSMHKNPADVLRSVKAEHWEGYGQLRAFGEGDVRGSERTLLEAIGQWVTG